MTGRVAWFLTAVLLAMAMPAEAGRLVLPDGNATISGDASPGSTVLVDVPLRIVCDASALAYPEGSLHVQRKTASPYLVGEPSDLRLAEQVCATEMERPLVLSFNVTLAGDAPGLEALPMNLELSVEEQTPDVDPSGQQPTSMSITVKADYAARLEVQVPESRIKTGKSGHAEVVVTNLGNAKTIVHWKILESPEGLILPAEETLDTAMSGLGNEKTFRITYRPSETFWERAAVKVRATPVAFIDPEQKGEGTEITLVFVNGNAFERALPAPGLASLVLVVAAVALARRR